jgi:NAD(P)-dependent dehydrogenase (short-subunit alcohol dehydrogenase family)
MNSSKVWYVTGASQGLGLILVKRLLDHGYRVAATSRKISTLSQAVGTVAEGRFLPMVVDLNDPASINDSREQTLAIFGRIDVVVNNAGYGMDGPLEEIPEEEIRNIINVNVLAVL